MFECDGKNQKVGVHPQTLWNVGARREFPPGRNKIIILVHNFNEPYWGKQTILYFRARRETSLVVPTCWNALASYRRLVRTQMLGSIAKFFNLVGLRWSIRTCIPTKFQSDAAVAGMRKSLCESSLHTTQYPLDLKLLMHAP